MSDRPLAYVLRPYDVTKNDMRMSAHLTCHSCGKTDKIAVINIGNNPEKIEKLFTSIGWDCIVHKPKECICPRCVAKLKAERIETKSRQTDARVLPTTMKPVGAISGLPKTRLESIVLASGTRSSPRGDVVTIKSLSPQQKASLRQELDGTFDDSTGRYLAGSSDRIISEKLGIPMAVVVEFRENFYGELKEDPLVVELRQGIEANKRSLSYLQSEIAKLEEKLEQFLKRKN